MEYFEADGASILGMLIQDIPDRDFFGMIFARAARLRYRSAGMTEFVETPEEARADLAAALAAADFPRPHAGTRLSGS